MLLRLAFFLFSLLPAARAVSPDEVERGGLAAAEDAAALTHDAAAAGEEERGRSRVLLGLLGAGGVAEDGRGGEQGRGGQGGRGLQGRVLHEGAEGLLQDGAEALLVLGAALDVGTVGKSSFNDFVVILDNLQSWEVREISR